MLLESLAALSDEPAPHRLFPVFFRARMACDQGFFPSLSACRACGAAWADLSGAVFHVEEGRLLCPACHVPGRGTFLHLGRETVALLEAVRGTGPAMWSALDPSPAAAGEFSRLLDRFVAYHLGLSWEHGTFVKN